MVKTQKLQVRVGPNLKAALEEEAARREMRLGELMRYALNDFILRTSERDAA